MAAIGRTTSNEITSDHELTELLGVPIPRVANKARTSLHPIQRDWIAHSPFCLVATSAADGSCDVSPKGDPPGFTRVLDPTLLAVPERKGNRRADGFRNILSNPHVGLIFFVPGRTDTLRVNGRARLVRDAPYFDDMAVRGTRPVLAMEVDVDQAFFHCGKAFLRSELWRAESWRPDDVPSRAVIAKALERPDDPLEELEEYYGPAYAANLY
ncbi:pyridoxamine 5'-phosphate oxidase family protein [Pseudonocardia acaciae]|uniref:pyridoxamine 5'-phosphate oxidase family protein n=1 Tax=Pseudonocardia acaciae TaxID=551276 RepID=UPI00048D26FA|nr:pyridoxamine 5'-phosphate oxidase family protein [Pseudonocardia acaciae]